MPESPLEAARALRETLVGFEPEVFSGDDCATLAEELARTGKACSAAAARAAARAADRGAHQHRGFTNGVDWVARTTGSTAGQARAALGTASALEDCPATKAAVVSGELSLAQGEQITKAEVECPGGEAELLGVARGSSLQVLREKARTRRLEAADPEEVHARQRAARELRHWTDEAGMVRLDAALHPVVGIPIVGRIEAETDRIRRAARRQGSREPRAAHAADALVSLLEGTGRGRTAGPDMVIVWDRSRDDRCAEGEAHIVGGGPIPIAEARKQAERSFVKGVIHDGVRIETVRHIGRYIPVELRTALELGDPPGFDGLTCVDCGKRRGIERDHLDPVANGGPTSRANLNGRCRDCHLEKTEHDRQAGLLGGKGGVDEEERGPP